MESYALGFVIVFYVNMESVDFKIGLYLVGD